MMGYGEAYADGVIAGILILALTQILIGLGWAAIAVAKWAWAAFKRGVRAK
jgi:hypothetical protein